MVSGIVVSHLIDLWVFKMDPDGVWIAHRYRNHGFNHHEWIESFIGINNTRDFMRFPSSSVVIY